MIFWKYFRVIFPVRKISYQRIYKDPVVKYFLCWYKGIQKKFISNGLPIKEKITFFKTFFPTAIMLEGELRPKWHGY